ncbi:unnamed protein product [Durusdinium trenchii]|uniref:Uncharacterized protein n=1 Tax=Durusdinium trenchii TaxID=1381693 RepID=A0ABP0RYW3_9DINO
MAWESEASDAVPEVYEDSTVTSGPPTQRAQKEEKTEALDLLEISKAVRRAPGVVSTAPFQKFSEEATVDDDSKGLPRKVSDADDILCKFWGAHGPQQVKLNLHNAYRDVHFWKLSDGADFEKEARAAEMRARPHYEVATLEIDSEVPAARRYLDRFTWSNPDHIWEEFEAPFLDMGTCFLNRPPRRFKLEVYNRGLVLARLQMELLGTGPLRAPWHDCMLGPGQRVTVPIDIKASEPGEWHGYIRIRGAWVNVFGVNEEEARIPTHLKVERADCGPCGPPQLPVHASSAKPESARPVSSRNGSTAVPSSRPLSALGPPSSRCLAAKRVWGDQCDGQFGMIWI